jgi:hypothetical protein
MKHRPFRIVFSSLNILVVFALFGSASTGASPAIVTNITRLQSASTTGIPNDLPRRLIAMDQAGGRTTDVETDGDLAYAALGPRIMAFDISNPDNPRLLGQSKSLGNLVQEVEVEDNLAYAVVSNFEGYEVLIFRVQDQKEFILAGSWGVDAFIRGMATHKGYLYLPLSTGTLLIIDVENPYQPELASAIKLTGGSLADSKLVGTLLYITASDGFLYVLDVTDPASPILVTSIDSGWWKSAPEIAVNETGLYVVTVQKLYIFDIAQPRSPNLSGVYQLFSDGEAVAAFGNYLAVTERGYLGRLTVVDVANRQSPRLVAALDMEVGGWKVAASGDYLYIADYGRGLQVVDVANPLLPVIAGSYLPVPMPENLVVEDGLLYLGDEMGALSIAAVEPGIRPLSLYSKPWEGHWYTCPDGSEFPGSDTIYDLALSGDYAYAAAGISGLEVFSVADPENPLLVGSLDTPAPVFGVFLSGDKAYLAEDCYGLSVVDIRDPQRPVNLGSYRDIYSAKGVSVIEHYAYVTDNHNGLYILDVQDPAMPTLVSSLTDVATWDLSISGQYLYLPTLTDFRIYDVSDPAQPSLVSKLEDVHGYYIAVDGGYAFITSQSKVWAVDVSDPGHPFLVAAAETPGLAMGIAVSDGNLYIADDDCGVTVMRLTDKVYFLPLTFR